MTQRLEVGKARRRPQWCSGRTVLIGVVRDHTNELGHHGLSYSSGFFLLFTRVTDRIITLELKTRQSILPMHPITDKR